MEIRIAHSLESAEVQRRMAQVATQHDIELTPEGELNGRLAKNVMLVGAVSANYTITPDQLCVDVTEYPAMLEGTLRRLLEDELTRALG
jgi:hypothetical protein